MTTATSEAKPDGRRRPRRAPVPTFAPPPVRPLDTLPTGYTSNPLPPAGLIPDLPPESGQERPPSPPESDEPTNPGVSGGGWLAGAREALKASRWTDRIRTARTETFSTGDDVDLDEGTIAEIFIGITAVIVSVGAWLVSRRHAELTIRRPDELQEARIAGPFSRIVMRHFPIEAFPDLVDGARLVGAVSEYMTDGPLIVPVLNPGEIPDPNEGAL